MSDPRQALGRDGEDDAASFLAAKGFRILARRWRCAIGELDLVAEDGDELVFVEVKSRTRDGEISPADAVGAAKRRRVRRVASWFLAEEGAEERICRFDVVEVIAGNPPEIRHWEDAFRPGLDDRGRRPFG